MVLLVGLGRMLACWLSTTRYAYVPVSTKRSYLRLRCLRCVGRLAVRATLWGIYPSSWVPGKRHGWKPNYISRREVHR